MRNKTLIGLAAVVLVGSLLIALDDTSRDPLETPELSYTPANLIAHTVARLKRNQCNVAEIRLVNVKLFGIDAENALLTGNFDVIPRETPNIQQTFGLALRTADAGRTWVQVLDTVDRRIPYISDVKFIGKRGLLLYEHSRAGNSFGFLYSQSSGETWIDSKLEGISGSFYLVDWSVRRPHQGIAVVHSDSGIPIDKDINRETKYWVVKTQNGFRWRIERTIERGKDENSDPDSVVWPSEWDETDNSWLLTSEANRAAIVRAPSGQPNQEVLSLPTGVIWQSSDTDTSLLCDYPSPSRDR
ncbi:MAG: hypothetical protein AAAFM81_08590 [Pseudomonadota bacterium]